MLDRLRHRLVFASFGLVVGAAAMFSSSLWFAFELAEDRLFDTHLAREVDSLMTLYASDPALARAPHENFLVYVAEDGSRADLPPHVAALGPEADDLELDGREYHVETRQRGASIYYFLFDESAFETFENALLATVGLLFAGTVLLAGWLSMGIADRVIRPLSRLSAQVSALDENGGGRIDPGPGADGDDEIGVLARAIARYHQRISALLAREREFSADVSHELRTPLMGVQGAAELLERRSSGAPEIAELGRRIRRGCQHMTTLTEALLYLAREPASFRDLVEPVSIEGVVETQINVVREVAERKGIRVNVEREGDPATVNTIPAVANIVIGNILKNAIKYTDRDVVSVFVTARDVVVQDYGPGIDRSAQGALFERFERGRQRDPDGSGIGLALVRRFCEQYGWTIDFRSEVNKGTRVAVSF